MGNGCVYKPDAFPITCPELTQTSFWTLLAIRNSNLRRSDVWRLRVERWTHRHKRNAATIGGLPLLLPVAKICFIMQSSLLLSYCRHWLCPAGAFKRGISRFCHSFPSESWRSAHVLQRLISPAWDVENAVGEWASIQGTTFRPGSGLLFTSFFFQKRNKHNTLSVGIYIVLPKISWQTYLSFLPCLLKLMDP